MILPDSITPFPVSPFTNSSPETLLGEDFVSTQAVRKVLLGPCAEIPVVGLPAVEFVGFAARPDVSSRDLSEPFYFDNQPLSVHPAFADIPPVAPPRRARAPMLQVTWEDRLVPVGRATDLWWMFALLLTLSSVLTALTLRDGTRAQLEAMSHPMSEDAIQPLEIPNPQIGPAVANLR